MPILSFGEYRPDVADYSGQHSKTILNVFPRGDGYGPVQSISAYTSSLPAPCRGHIYAKKNDGSIQVFAATADSIYKLDNTGLSWTLCSPVLASVASNAQWEFRQFNNYVFATHGSVNLQVYDLTSSTLFADVAGSPPQAAHIAIVNRFVVLSGLSVPSPYAIQWSGLNATTTWTSGVTQSDYQELADGGIVRGVAGGEYGVIFQDQAIRRMTYAPGSPLVFSINRISSDDGLLVPTSLISAQDRLFFLSPQGFKMMVPGGYPTPIGKEKVDRTFFADADLGSSQMIIGASDPRYTRVYWTYKSNSGTSGQFDKMLAYDWALDRWSPIVASGEYLASLSQPGTTLESLDTLYGTNIDTIVLSSFDDIASAATAKLSIVDTTHALGFFSGSNLEATMQTPEQSGDGKRFFFRGFRPVSDAPTIYGAINHRDTAQASVTTSTETLANSVGICPQRVASRYARAVCRVPAATTWTYASGVEFDANLEGKR